MYAQNESPQELSRIYSKRFNDQCTYRMAVWREIINLWLGKIIRPETTVLDLGTGYGEFINQIKVHKRLAMDLNPDTQKHLDPLVEFHAQSCTDTWKIPDDSLDIIFTSNLFEHLPDKGSLKKTLTHAYKALKPGGVVMALGPNIKYLPGSYWDFWDHKLPLTELSLAELGKLCGFKVIQALPRTLPYSMSQGFTPPLAALKIYLRLSFLWPLFGKQFFVVLRK